MKNYFEKIFLNSKEIHFKFVLIIYRAKQKNKNSVEFLFHHTVNSIV